MNRENKIPLVLCDVTGAQAVCVLLNAAIQLKVLLPVICD